MVYQKYINLLICVTMGLAIMTNIIIFPRLQVQRGPGPKVNPNVHESQMQNVPKDEDRPIPEPEIPQVIEPNKIFVAEPHHLPSDQKADAVIDLPDKPQNEGLDTGHNANTKQYDVALTSYMRSGSTLTGLVLGHRSDSFYVYEPLWKVARWAYWRGNDTICRTDDTECRTISPDESPDPKFMDNQIPSYTASLREAQKILKDVYDCQMNNFQDKVFSKGLTMKLGGPAWDPIKSCLDRGGDEPTCIFIYGPQICKNAKHRVTKVLRLTLDNIEYLLQSKDNLKVIHLYRDPRAIMNSRVETKWYPSNDISLLLRNAESLCKKMIYDHQKGIELLRKYPDRFRFVYYEDLNDGPLNKVKKLYSYLGMDLDESKYSVIKDISVFKEASSDAAGDRTKNTAFWWRKTLDWEIVKHIDNVCLGVYESLGYVQFTQLDELRNLAIPSLSIPQEYLL